MTTRIPLHGSGHGRSAEWNIERRDTMAQRPQVRYVRRLAHRSEDVWQAITESDSLKRWFPADIVGARRPGAPVKLPFWPEALERLLDEADAEGIGLESASLPGEIRAYAPPQLFELVWGSLDGNHDVLRFELDPADGGTLLVLTIWPGGPWPAGHGGSEAGFHRYFDALENLLDTGAVRTILESVLNVSLAEWPADSSLEDAGLYDSLAQLETISRLEKRFGLTPGNLDVKDIGTIDRILARLVLLTPGGAS